MIILLIEIYLIGSIAATIKIHTSRLCPDGPLVLGLGILETSTCEVISQRNTSFILLTESHPSFRIQAYDLEGLELDDSYKWSPDLITTSVHTTTPLVSPVSANHRCLKRKHQFSLPESLLGLKHCL